MSQNSLTISPSQNGTDYTTALNNALNSLVTNNSGVAAPATTYAGMWWVDTSAAPWVVKVRNSDDSGWVSLLTLANGSNTLNIVGLDPFTKVKTNLAATTAPIATNDSGSGYGVGSIWIDTTNDRSYICVDALLNNAVWREIGIDQYSVKTNQENAFTAQQRNVPVTLTDGATISWNLITGQVAKVTLGGNRVLSNPTNMRDGAFYTLIVKQDGTGSRTLGFGTAYKFENGIVPTLSTGVGAVDIFTFVSDGTNMYGAIGKNFA